MERDSKRNKTVALAHLEGFANSPHMAGEGEEGVSDGSEESDGSDDAGDGGVEMRLLM